MPLGIDAVLEADAGGIYDIKIGFDGDIETADQFDTYIIVALMTDRRASESEVLRPERRRGWIGNEHTPGFEMGSKLWIFEQRRLTRTTMNDLKGAAIDALQSMVEENLAQAVRSVDIRVFGNGVVLEVEILRSPNLIEKRYFDLWQNTGAS